MTAASLYMDELEGVLRERDRRIKELEQQNQSLRSTVRQLTSAVEVDTLHVQDETINLKECQEFFSIDAQDLRLLLASGRFARALFNRAIRFHQRLRFIQENADITQYETKDELQVALLGISQSIDHVLTPEEV